MAVAAGRTAAAAVVPAAVAGPAAAGAVVAAAAAGAAAAAAPAAPAAADAAAAYAAAGQLNHSCLVWFGGSSSTQISFLFSSDLVFHNPSFWLEQQQLLLL